MSIPFTVLVILMLILCFLVKIDDMISLSTGTLTCSTIRIMEFPEKDINPLPLSHGILTDSGALSEHSYVEEEYLSPQRLVSCCFTNRMYVQDYIKGGKRGHLPFL